MQASNHHGIKVGTVIAVKGKKITIRLIEDLHQNDGIRFEKENWSEGCHVNYIYNKQGKLVNSALKNQTITIDGPLHVKVGNHVKKTVDANLQDEVKSILKSYHRQIEIVGKVSCQGVGHPLVLELSDGKHTVRVQSQEMAQLAKSKASDPQTIEKQMRKTNTSWARFSRIEYDVADDVFFSLKAMNALRKEGLDALKEAHLRFTIEKERPYTYSFTIQDAPMIFAQIEEEHQKGKEDVVWIAEHVSGAKKLARITEDEGFVVRHLGKGPIIFNMNVSNSYAIAALIELGYEKIGVSDELSKEQLLEMIDGFRARYHQIPPIVPCLYQKRRLMLMKHCPINTLLSDGKRIGCRLCHEHNYLLKGKDRRTYSLLGDSACNMRIFSREVEDRFDWLPSLRKRGIDSYLCIFVDESKKTIDSILRRLSDEIGLE